MKRVAALLVSVVAAVAQAQTAVYREGSTYTDRPSPGATRVTIVLNLMDSQPVSTVPTRPLMVAAPAPQPPAPQVVINITVRQPSPYNYGGQRHRHYQRSYR